MTVLPAFWLVLWLCSAAGCEARYAPDPIPGPYACTAAGIVLKGVWQAKGFTCVHDLPEGATPLPGAVVADRWA